MGQFELDYPGCPNLVFESGLSQKEFMNSSPNNNKAEHAKRDG